MAQNATSIRINPSLIRFAELLEERIGASRVLLFGSHATGREGPESDYDLIVVADSFRDVPRFEREFGLRAMYYEIAEPAPMDIFCLTPEEFDNASNRITLLAAVLPEAIDLLAA